MFNFTFWGGLDESWSTCGPCIVSVYSENWAPTRTTEQRPCLAPEIKIMWEEQLVDPYNDYITSVNVPLPSVLY